MMSGGRVAVAALGILLLAGLNSLGVPTSTYDPGPEQFVYYTPTYHPLECLPIWYLADVGWVCQPDPRLRWYLLYDGPWVVGAPPNWLGHTHGMDVLPAPQEGTFPLTPGTPFLLQAPHLDPQAPRRVPYCEEASAGTYTTRFYHVRAIDDFDDPVSDAMVRDYIHFANGLYHATAQTHHTRDVDLRMECEQGRVRVVNLVLPTPLASTDLSTIISDIQATPGGADANVKHWILFDEFICPTCDGVTTWYPDDRPIATNMNNGDRLPLYSVAYVQEWHDPTLGGPGTLPDPGKTALALIHGLTHTMGAVHYKQMGAGGDFSDWAGNCLAGYDLMCTDEPHGYAQGPFMPSVVGPCLPITLSCDPTDYYEPNGSPASAYYHWNVGNTDNHYLVHGATPMQYVECIEAPVGLPTVCTYLGGHDRAAGVQYTIDWGDGASTMDPPSGSYTDPKTSAWDHVYTMPGTYTVKVQATVGAAKSGWMPYTVTVT